MVVLAPWQAQGGDEERLKLAANLVEKTRQTEMFATLAETFMETYFERYDNPGAENPAADHAAEAIAIYDLGRRGAYGLPVDGAGR